MKSTVHEPVDIKKKKEEIDLPLRLDRETLSSDYCTDNPRVRMLWRRHQKKGGIEKKGGRERERENTRREGTSVLFFSGDSLLTVGTRPLFYARKLLGN